MVDAPVNGSSSNVALRDTIVMDELAQVRSELARLEKEGRDLHEWLSSVRVAIFIFIYFNIIVSRGDPPHIALHFLLSK